MININNQFYFIIWNSQPKCDNRKRIFLFQNIGLMRIVAASCKIAAYFT